ncbi:DNA/pantothenate metabolism flavoprotein [Leptospira inadai serovar Lyme str. 10]|uniref:DNA/pantothenate metabolism flavoprotein n=2 Tax=Leptospira inadai serovar Lyme TaxID=293084 RepID=V6HQI4_9LEPT|nr:phosphopantothenoylcysteine decarboxylase [Leptospira inadai]EQA34689.1 DNA/pantothenate metabolism flavoprotein [Leptospira inadai serovar Lyme str. 10]PNV76185.1 DNA/pantothenate metabolism flavoprotein [Leptospira inadai serovar Lyme]
MNIQKIVISSGSTREWIDPVRFISNASSGKMGFCIAESASDWSNNVVYIRGLTQPEYSNPKGARVISVETTSQMQQAILTEMASDTVLIMAAAPADFRPLTISEAKIKKEDGTEIISLELAKNPDILASVSAKATIEKYTNTHLVGFSAETHKLEEHAIGKLRRKNLDYIVGNYVSKEDKGFGDRDTSVIIFGKDGSKKEIGPASKQEIAKRLIEYLRSR